MLAQTITLLRFATLFIAVHEASACYCTAAVSLTSSTYGKDKTSVCCGSNTDGSRPTGARTFKYCHTDGWCYTAPNGDGGYKSIGPGICGAGGSGSNGRCTDDEPNCAGIACTLTDTIINAAQDNNLLPGGSSHSHTPHSHTPSSSSSSSSSSTSSSSSSSNSHAHSPHAHSPTQITYSPSCDGVSTKLKCPCSTAKTFVCPSCDKNCKFVCENEPTSSECADIVKASFSSSSSSSSSSSTSGEPAAASTSGEPAADPCFPSTAVVTLADGSKSLIGALKDGDAIVAATADGALTTDTLTLVSVTKPEENAATYVAVTTAANQTVTLTPGHHLPVGTKCCSTLKKAKDVEVGETVWAAMKGGKVAATTVTAKAAVTATGLHSPVLVNGGFPIVDGVVTAFDSIEKVTLAAYGLAPLLKACKVTGSCDAFRNTFASE